MESNTVQQEFILQNKPQQEHHWLQKLVGEWIYESEVLTESNQPPEKASGTETVRSLGELWILAEGQGKMPCGGDETTMMTLGYDLQKQQYVGTWIGSMMAYLWVYDGELDASENRLTLNNEGPSMSEAGKMAKYKDVIEFQNDNHRTLTTYTLGDDGQWHPLITTHYQRKM